MGGVHSKLSCGLHIDVFGVPSVAEYLEIVPWRLLRVAVPFAANEGPRIGVGAADDLAARVVTIDYETRNAPLTSWEQIRAKADDLAARLGRGWVVVPQLRYGKGEQ